MANSAPFDVIASPADIYVAAPNTTQPTIQQAMDPGMLFPAGSAATQGQVTTGGLTGWYYLGYTDGGIQVTPGQTIQDLFVDQTVFPVKSSRTQQTLEIGFAFAELTIDSFALAMGNTISAGAIQGITTDAGNKFKSIALGQSSSINQVAMCIRWPSPYGDYIAQWELPYVFQSGNPQIRYQKGTLATLAVTFKVLGASAANFGTLRARHLA